MKTGRLIVSILLISLLCNSVIGVIMDPSINYGAGNFMLHSRSSVNVSVISPYQNCVDLGNFGNITFVSNCTADNTPIGVTNTEYNLPYDTNISVDVYAPVDWSVPMVFLRVHSADDVLAENISASFSSQFNSTHRRYTGLYNPVDTLSAAKRGNFNVSVFAYALNTTLVYNGNRMFASVFEVFRVDPPYNGAGSYNVTFNGVNLTWTNGNNSDSQVVVQGNSSYPDGPTDGWVRQNNTGSWFNDSNVYSTRYYTVFSYNSTYNVYSTGLNIPWGAVGLSCFNESNTSQAIGFDIEISNSDGSTTYTASGLTNTQYIDFNSIPYGDDTIIIVSNSSYKQSTVYADLIVNTWFNFTFFLVPIEVPGAGGPGGSNNSLLCLISVVDEMSQALPDANVTVKRYIAATDSYETVRRILSDGNGQVSCWLQVNQNYMFDISKQGYTQLGTKYWTPTELIYTKTFMMSYNPFDPQPDQIIPEEISFSGQWSGNDLVIVYDDNMGQTINASVLFYMLNHSTNLTSLQQKNTTTANISTFYLMNANTSNTFIVYLHYNHTIWGYQTKMLIFEPDLSTLTTPNRINVIMNPLFGYHPIGWGNFLMFLFLVAAFYYIDQRDAGIVVVLLGGMFLFINVAVGFNDTLQSFSGGFIPILFIVTGIISMWNTQKRRVVG